jgi:hypothetical protein
MYILKSRAYLVYNIFCEAHFIQADGLLPILAQINPIKDEPNNIAISLPYKKRYKLKDINFTEDNLIESQKVDDYYLIPDEHEASRKIKFLKLKNIFTPDRRNAGSGRDFDFFS